MRHLVLTLVLLLACTGAVAQPQMQYNGEKGRIVNPDRVQYYCWIEYITGHTEGMMLYPGQATRWMTLRHIRQWRCQ